MTKQMALDYAKDRIHVNCICPGFVESPMIAALTANTDVKKSLDDSHPWGAIGTDRSVSITSIICTTYLTGLMTLLQRYS
jgi:NAD(P)-dependent dehydrogenase (short-subunit alcohol dehydrogenase family)